MITHYVQVVSYFLTKKNFVPDKKKKEKEKR